MGCVLGDCVGYAWCVGLFVSMWSEYVGVCVWGMWCVRGCGVHVWGGVWGV